MQYYIRILEYLRIRFSSELPQMLDEANKHRQATTFVKDCMIAWILFNRHISLLHDKLPHTIFPEHSYRTIAIGATKREPIKMQQNFLESESFLPGNREL